MREYVLLLLSTVLVNNVVLVKFLGLCPFMGISKKTDTAISMGLATTFVMTMASAACWMLEHWLLVPLGMVYLRILVYILVIAVVVQFTEMVVRKTNPALYQVLGIYLPLITTNCAVLGIPLLTTQEKLPFVQQPAVRLRFGRRFHAGAVAVRRTARAAGPGASAARVRRRTDRIYYGQLAGIDVYGLCGFGLSRVGTYFVLTRFAEVPVGTKSVPTLPGNLSGERNVHRCCQSDSARCGHGAVPRLFRAQA